MIGTGDQSHSRGPYGFSQPERKLPLINGGRRFRNLQMQTGALPAADKTIAFSADELVLVGPSVIHRRDTGTITLDADKPGVGGRREGDLSDDTWYYIYAAADPNSPAISGFVSTDSAAEGMAGFECVCLLGAAYYNSSTGFFNSFLQREDHVMIPPVYLYEGDSPYIETETPTDHLTDLAPLVAPPPVGRSMVFHLSGNSASADVGIRITNRTVTDGIVPRERVEVVQARGGGAAIYDGQVGGQSGPAVSIHQAGFGLRHLDKAAATLKILGYNING